MTLRHSNTKFLTVLDPLPLDNIGWEAVALNVGALGDLTVMQRVYRAVAMTGSKVRNDFGMGSINIPKDDVLWDEILPSPLVGVNPLNREFLWRFYEDGVLRHEFFGEDITEDIAVEGESPRMNSISGRTPEVVLNWGVHVPAWAEVQEVTLDDSAESGSFILKFGAGRTNEIPHNATSAVFKAAAVDGISGLSNDDIAVSKRFEDGQRKWTVEFIGKYIEGNAVPPGFSPKSSTVETDVSTGGVQVVALSQDASAGTFVLEFGADASLAINHNASAAGFKTALVDGIVAITAGNINVTKTLEEGVIKWRIEYVGDFADPDDPTDNPGLALKSSDVTHGTSQYFPSVSALASGGTAKYFPSVSDITQVDYYADPEPRTAASAFLGCLERCQDRDILPFLVPLFDEDVDSFGDPWLDFDVQEVNPGETLLSMLQRFAEAYGWEFRVLPGFRLQVTQSGFGLDRSASVRFWLGGHQIKHSLARTSREMLTRVWAQTNSNIIVEAQGTSSSSSLARETWIDGFEGDSSYAQQVANQTRDERIRQTKLREVKFPYNQDNDHRLFDDFSYCDFVGVEDDRNVMHVLKIESVAWSIGPESPIDFEVTFFGE